MASVLILISCVAMALALPPPHAASDSYAPVQALPLGFELPREESAPVPFFIPDLSTSLKAPQYSPEPSYYEIPIPAQDLIAPIQTAWNPENDPKFFYEVPALLTQQTLPTNAFPKKYNQEIHSKSKPFASRPKQELTLQPIDREEFNSKQKSLIQTFDQLAKKENKKLIKEPQQTIQI